MSRLTEFPRYRVTLHSLTTYMSMSDIVRVLEKHEDAVSIESEVLESDYTVRILTPQERAYLYERAREWAAM